MYFPKAVNCNAFDYAYQMKHGVIPCFGPVCNINTGICGVMLGDRHWRNHPN